jgi:hypothetical protein
VEEFARKILVTLKEDFEKVEKLEKEEKRKKVK